MGSLGGAVWRWRGCGGGGGWLRFVLRLLLFFVVGVVDVHVVQVVDVGSSSSRIRW